MTLDYKPSALDPPNATDTNKTALLIDSNDKIDTTEKLYEEYYDVMIDQNHLDFLMVREKVKVQCRDLCASIDLFNESKLP